MSNMKFYGYRKCSTCRKAESFLNDHGIEYDYIDITEKPPTKSELKMVMKNSGQPLKKLFNTNGQVYREMGLKDKVDSMSESEAIQLLSTNGRLMKRPIAIDADTATIGFKEDDYRKRWL